jgi:hypothetical protein
MDKNSAVFTYLKNKFPSISDVKIKERIFIFLFCTMTNKCTIIAEVFWCQLLGFTYFVKSNGCIRLQ